MTQMSAPAHHPAAPTTAKYCIQILEEHGGEQGTPVILLIELVVQRAEVSDDTS